jgi:hypothetical protein
MQVFPTSASDVLRWRLHASCSRKARARDKRKDIFVLVQNFCDQ